MEKIKIDGTTIFITVLAVFVLYNYNNPIIIPQTPENNYKMFQGEFTINIKNTDGSAVKDGAITAYITKVDKYKNTTEIRKTFNDKGGIAASYGCEECFATASISKDGNVKFQAQARSESNGGDDYALYIHDNNNNDWLFKIKLEGHYSPAGDQVITALIRDGYVYEIVLSNPNPFYEVLG